MEESAEFAEQMLIAILNGAKKEESPYVTDAASSALWDQLVKEIKDIEAEGMTVQIPDL